MPIDAPLRLHRDSVRPEWIDFNGHMNVAYYVLAFDHATDALYGYLGLGQERRDASGDSMFTVECHVTYQRELKEGDPMVFSTQVLGYDEKRLHYIHHMYHEVEGFLAATTEWLCLHVNLNSRRVGAMAPEVLARVRDVAAAHEALPWPPEAGRTIRRPVAS